MVNTAYAILALLDAKYPHVEPIRRAVRLLMKRQQENGEWLQESIEGVFNKNCRSHHCFVQYALCILLMPIQVQSHIPITNFLSLFGLLVGMLLSGETNKFVNDMTYLPYFWKCVNISATIIRCFIFNKRTGTYSIYNAGVTSND